MRRSMPCTGKRLSGNESCTRHSLREGQVTSQIAHNALADFDEAEHTGTYCTELSRKEHIMQLGMIGLATPPGSSDAEEIARMVPPGARVVKAFNTTFARTLVAGTVAGQPLDVFITGDDAAAKATVSQLVEAGGLRAIDAGPLAHAHYLEGLAFLGMKLQFTLGTQFQSAWKLLA